MTDNLIVFSIYRHSALVIGTWILGMHLYNSIRYMIVVAIGRFEFLFSNF